MVAATDAAPLVAICATVSSVFIVVVTDLGSAGAVAAVCVAAGAGPTPFNTALDVSAVWTVEADAMPGIGPMKSGDGAPTADAGYAG